MTRRGLLLFILLSCVWGIPYLLIKVAVDEVSPAVIVALRVGLAAAVLLPIALRRRQWRSVVPVWPWVLLFAVTEISGPFLLISVAEQRLSSGLTALLIAATPIMAVILAALLRLHDPVSGSRAAGLAVGVIGVAALVGLDVRGGDLLGVAAVLLAALGYAIAPIIVATRLRGVDSVTVITLALLLNTLGYAPVAWTQWPVIAPSALAWAAIAILGIVCTAVAFVALFALIDEVGASRANVITFLNPAVAVILGALLLGEPITLGVVVGFVLVVSGSVLATRRPQPAGGQGDGGTSPPATAAADRAGRPSPGIDSAAPR